MKSLTLEIHGTGTHNRGAELMAIAIAERMRATFPGVRIVVPPKFGDFASRARHEFLTTWEFPGRFRAGLLSFAVRQSSPNNLSALGIVDPAEVDAVLDASGFAFSDQWGAGAAKTLLAKMNIPARKKKPLILLPQALGPFERTEVAFASRALFARASLVCARDEQSYSAVKSLGGASLLVKYPDFTLSVSPRLPPELNLPDHFSAIVPNYRMLDKTDKGDSYIAFLLSVIDRLRAASLQPVFVLHDALEDRRVIELVLASIDIPVFQHADPRVLKGILGKAEIVVGSRFHALVSSLSQGIPCIGAGWSHKYPELFRDFDAADLLISDIADTSQLGEVLDRLTELSRRSEYSTRIAAAANRLKEQSLKMWEEVEAMLKIECGYNGQQAVAT